MKVNRIKLFAIAIITLPMFAIAILSTSSLQVTATPTDDDPAAVYKAKCAMCHSPKAEKAFDPSKKDEELVEIILKGKKAEKPPHMPGYEAKGMTKEQAQALVTYMREIRKSAD
jgi:mono/diheme cytochrome c family protein